MKFEFKGNIHNRCKITVRPDSHQNDDDIEVFIDMFAGFLRKHYQVKIKDRFVTNFGDKAVIFERESSEGNRRGSGNGNERNL